MTLVSAGVPPGASNQASGFVPNPRCSGPRYGNAGGNLRAVLRWTSGVVFGNTQPKGEAHTVTMRESLDQALHLPEGETTRRLREYGLAVVNVDTMAQAIHDVYCGIMADHEHPNEKDRSQAEAMVAAIQKQEAPQPQA
jgi:hypothetical protein